MTHKRGNRFWGWGLGGLGHVVVCTHFTQLSLKHTHTHSWSVNRSQHPWHRTTSHEHLKPDQMELCSWQTLSTGKKRKKKATTSNLEPITSLLRKHCKFTLNRRMKCTLHLGLCNDTGLLQCPNVKSTKKCGASVCVFLSFVRRL